MSIAAAHEKGHLAFMGVDLGVAPALVPRGETVKDSLPIATPQGEVRVVVGRKQRANPRGER